MSGNLHQAFGLELAAQRRTQFELQARHDGLVRRLRRQRRADRADAAAGHSARRAPQPCCAADLG
ncbi:MAG TPA: hypothetical protein VH372_22465 [Actinospica sp.]|jgi:hypothetical protein|nr:hypothetical protein [Actinospica sp.]